MTKVRMALFVGVLAVVSFLYSLDRLMLAVLAHPIKEELHISDSAFGLIAGLIFAATTTLFSVPIARLADRTSRSGVLAGCLAVWSATTAMCGAVGNVTHLALARIGVGVGEGGAISIVHALIGANLPPKRRAFAISMVGAGIYSGATAAFIMGGWLGEVIGWRAAFFVVAVPGLLLALLVPSLTKQGGASSETRKMRSGKSGPGLAQTLRQLAASPAFILITLSAVMCGGISNAISTWKAVFVMRSYDLSVGEAGLLLGLSAGLASVAGQLVGGVICSRASRPENIVRGPALAFGLSAVLYVVAFHAPDARTLMLLLILPAFFSAMWYPALFASLQNVVADDSRAQATSVAQVFIHILGNGFGPTMVGLASDALAPAHGQDSLRVALSGVALLGLVAAAIMLTLDAVLRRSYRATAPEPAASLP
jgi:predicted MFS family arabinose efflux permease